jgi:drug/metabolite transporter (DMT)-like permease
LTNLGEPIGSTILAILVFGELPNAWQLVGAALILVALWLAGQTQPESAEGKTLATAGN